MIGSNYVDVYEEKLSIGQVLDDAENYGAVISAVSVIASLMISLFINK